MPAIEVGTRLPIANVAVILPQHRRYSDAEVARVKAFLADRFPHERFRVVEGVTEGGPDEFLVFPIIGVTGDRGHVRKIEAPDSEKLEIIQNTLNDEDEVWSHACRTVH